MIAARPLASGAQPARCVSSKGCEDVAWILPCLIFYIAHDILGIAFGRADDNHPDYMKVKLFFNLFDMCIKGTRSSSAKRNPLRV